MLFDVRDVLKSLRRAPGYALTVVLTLAATIGATTAVFSIVDGVLLKPLAYRESHRLVSIREVWKQLSRNGAAFEVNEQHFGYWRAHAEAFASMAQYIALPANLTGRGEAAQIVVVRTSGSIFDVLLVPPALGRTLTPDDERADRPAVAMLTDRAWRQRFAADRAIVGKTVAIDGTPHTVVGVLPAGLRLPVRSELTDELDAFVPIRMANERVGWVGDHNNDAIARLKDGVGTEQARAELDVLQRQVSVRATADAHEPVTLSSAVTPLADTIVGRARTGLLLLMAAVLAVLLIACSNLANLSLTRAISRQRESAIRSALGASRRRLVLVAALEQTLLSVAGGACGIGIAWAAVAVFVRSAAAGIPRVADVTLDGRVLAFAAVVSLATGFLVALLPAARLAGRWAQASLRSSGTAFTGDRGAMRTRASLVALQVGMSVTLLVVTALLSVSFVRLMNVDRGFEVARVLAVPVALPAVRYEAEPVRRAAYDRLIAGVRALAGVDSVTTTSSLPLTGQGQVNFVAAREDTRPRAEHPTANFRFVAPDFFRTLGLPVLRGRSFTDRERDPNRPAPAVISNAMASRLWQDGDALGRVFSRGEPDEQPFEVVGIVGDAHTTSLEGVPPLMVYAPYWWRSRTTTTLMVRSAMAPASLLPAVRQAIARIDPDIAIGDARPLEQVADRALAPRRYQMRLFVAFGAVALLIATLGVYATTAYGVSRRRREMNIRVALGAQPAQVLRMVVREGTAPVFVGIAGGTAGAVAIGGLIASLLFDVRARDPIVIACVVAAVGLVGVMACATAARQALVLNPAAALREE
jgi:putative ABC transport system permease protein